SKNPAWHNEPKSKETTVSGNGSLITCGKDKKGKPVCLLKYDLGKDPATGKRRQRYATVRGTKGDAKMKLRELLRLVDTNAVVYDSQIPLRDYMSIGCCPKQ